MINDKVWKELVKEADKTGDGEISFDEFKLMMENVVKIA